MDHTDLLDVFSEEFSSFLPGSFVYCNPSEVETWTSTFDFGLPSPPETNSDCGSTDSQDMSSQTWSSQASQPEEWTSASAPEYSTYMEPSASGWPNGSIRVNAQDMQSFDNAAWLSSSTGPVNQGLSPVLSQESQSTHALNSIPDSDACVLPPGLDLSFATEPAWNPSGSAVYTGPSATLQPEQGSLPANGHVIKSNGCGPFQEGYFPAAPPSMCFPQGNQVAQTPRTFHPALARKRQLLPRIGGSPQSSSATHGQHRSLRPSIQGQRAANASFSSVSSSAGQPHEEPQHAVAQAGLSLAPSTSGSAMLSSNHGMHHALVYPQSAGTSQASASAQYIADPTAQDFSDFIHFDDQETTTSSAHMSYVQGYDFQCGSSLPVDSKAVMSQPEQDATAMYQGSIVNSGMAAETDEGRHRSHPLYAAEPHADGLFHCPYKAKDPNCPHRPTKLKCNYDKYIDSHLKPFRCKIESCAKQEFSSTACLLRHEREAHGMHGHGDRPHLCYYTGCERGIPGNGFPRRYNLFDHMKRVHDHKEDPRAGTRSPSVGNSQDKKVTASRKRKVSDPAPLEPATQRQRIMPASTQPVQAPQASQVYTAQPQEYFQQPAYAVPTARRTQSQSRVYHHWANQRDLIERQMGSVQSPDDEAGLQRLTQNVEEFRRLSDLVRRG